MFNILLLVLFLLIQPLEETFTSITMSFNYPSGWVVEDMKVAVVLATDEASLETGSPLDNEQMRATIITRWTEALPLQNPNAPLQEIITQLQTINTVSTCDAFEPLQLALIHQAAIYYTRQTCSSTDNLIIVKRFSHGALGIVVASSAAGEISNFESDLLQVAASLRYIQNAFTVNTETYSPPYIITAPPSFSLRLPAGWRIEEHPTDRLIGVTDGNTSLFDDEATLPDGTFSLITVYAADDLPTDVDASALNVLRWLTAEGQSGFEYTTPQSISINGREAARADLVTGVVDLTYLVIALGNDYYAAMNVFGVPGAFDEDAQAIYGILSTIEITGNQ
ncbi:MAG: hypothetical protein Kow00117_16780 [Phototrophicales bacterium]